MIINVNHAKKFGISLQAQAIETKHVKSPHCGKKKVIRHIGTFPSMTTDSELTPNKKTGGQWNDLMGKMKNYTPERYHQRLDNASLQTGKRWKG